MFAFEFLYMKSIFHLSVQQISSCCFLLSISIIPPDFFSLCCMSVPSTSLRHHVEVLTKVRQLRVFVWLKDDYRPRIGCKKDPRNGDLLVVLVPGISQSFDVVRVTLPSSITVDVSSAELSTKEGIATCLFKINVAEDNSSYMTYISLPTSDTLPLSAVNNVFCRVCDHPLLKDPSTIESYVLTIFGASIHPCYSFTDINLFYRITPLPSEYWTDMRDIWTCACTSEMFAKKLPRSVVVRAEPHQVQLAHSYLQLHSLDLDHSAITIDHAEPHTVAFHRNWKNLWCVRCGSPVGQAEMPNADTLNTCLHHHDMPSIHDADRPKELHQHSEKSHSSSAQAVDSPADSKDAPINEILFRNVRLHKYATKTCGDESFFASHNLETKLSSDILSTISVTGVFKLVFRDYRTRTPALQVTVLGWDSLIFSSISPLLPDVKLTYAASPAIRLTYSIVSSGSPIDPLSPIEIIESDCFSINTLLTLLESHHASLPPPISHLGHQPISFLHYIPPDV